MANLGPMFLGSYESISKHMETYEEYCELSKKRIQRAKKVKKPKQKGLF